MVFSVSVTDLSAFAIETSVSPDALKLPPEWQIKVVSENWLNGWKQWLQYFFSQVYSRKQDGDSAEVVFFFPPLRDQHYQWHSAVSLSSSTRSDISWSEVSSHSSTQTKTEQESQIGISCSLLLALQRFSRAALRKCLLSTSVTRPQLARGPSFFY